jgi:hypothetical protein
MTKFFCKLQNKITNFEIPTGSQRYITENTKLGYTMTSINIMRLNRVHIIKLFKS